MSVFGGCCLSTAYKLLLDVMHFSNCRTIDEKHKLVLNHVLFFYLLVF